MDVTGMDYTEINEVNYLVVFVTTTGEDEGTAISSALVEEGIAACVNMVKGVTSVFMWKGKVEKESECLLIIKTAVNRFHDLVQRVKEIHSYDVPEIIAVPIVEGNTPYLDWIDEVTQG